MPVSPSSLIFLVIVGVWAAYFVQYWVRRREHLSTARSMDRFSESMRVLQRRRPLPEADLGARPAPAYALTPSRPSRPQVLVKRAAYGDEVARAPRHPAPVRLASASQRTRGITFLCVVLLVLDLVVFAATGVSSWWLVPVSFVPLAGALAWVRAGARAIGAIRSPRRPSAPLPAAAVPARRGPLARPSAVPGPVTEARAEVVDLPVAAAYDIEAVEALAAPAPPERGVLPVPIVSTEDDIPTTWDPRPVPRPTYALKATARRPVPPAGRSTAAQPEVDELPRPSSRRVAGA